MKTTKTFNPSIEQTIPNFFPDIKQRKLAYTILKVLNIIPNRKLIFEKEPNCRGKCPVRLYLIKDLKKVQSHLTQSQTITQIPKGYTDVHTLERKYDLPNRTIYLIFKTVGLESNQMYKPEGLGTGRKLFKVKDTEYVMKWIVKSRERFSDRISNRES